VGSDSQQQSFKFNVDFRSKGVSSENFPVPYCPVTMATMSDNGYNTCTLQYNGYNTMATIRRLQYYGYNMMATMPTMSWYNELQQWSVATKVKLHLS
jgi:hypothetical protein